MEDVVEVLPDVTGIDRTFHYLAPGPLRPGTIVRVRLHGRRVRGWVVAAGTPVPAGVEARPLIEVVSPGPPPEVVELCRLAARRYAGRLRAFLVAASPERIVHHLPPPVAPPARPPQPGPLADAVGQALALSDAVVRLPPAAERQPVVEAVLAATPAREGAGPLVLVESRGDAARLAARLERAGWPVARYPEEWAAAATPGPVVVGTRNAAFSPRRPSVVVVLDAHSESYRSERAPTFDARVVAAERAAAEGCPVLFVTPCPPLELLAGRRLVTLGPAGERAGWGTVSVLDSREEDPAERGYPSLLVSWLRQAATPGGRPVVCVLDRVGRARLLTCGGCREVQRCDRCGAALVQLERPAPRQVGDLSCPRCRATRPAVCASCGSARLRLARAGVSRAREQLAAVTGLEVGEVSGRRAEVPPTPVLIGTQAVLHRVRAASLVAFLDFDQELLAPRFRAAEQALSLLARSVRLVGGRGAGRVVIRTSLPDHEVVRAARTGDPGLVEAAERERRLLLGLPPWSAMARLSGPGAPELVARLGPGVTTARVDGSVVVSAPDHEVLAASLDRLRAGEPNGWADLDVRVEVDPVDL